MKLEAWVERVRALGTAAKGLSPAASVTLEHRKNGSRMQWAASTSDGHKSECAYADGPDEAMDKLAENLGQALEKQISAHEATLGQLRAVREEP